MNQKKYMRRIEAIKKQLAGIGPIHPGSLSEQYNVCGTPGCCCKDPVAPRRHGPYYQLSYTRRGKSSTRFVRQSGIAAMRAKIANYKRFRELVNEWVDLAVDLEGIERSREN